MAPTGERIDASQGTPIVDHWVPSKTAIPGTSPDPLVAKLPVATSRVPHVPRFTEPNGVPKPRLSPGIPDNATPSHCESRPTAWGGFGTMRPFHGVMQVALSEAPPGIASQAVPSQRAMPPNVVVPEASELPPT